MSKAKFVLRQTSYSGCTTNFLFKWSRHNYFVVPDSLKSFPLFFSRSSGIWFFGAIPHFFLSDF